MKYKKTILTGLLGFLVLSCYSQSKKIDFEEFNLKNGLHVILYQDNSLPIVAINVMYHVGSKNEQPDRTGFAHFFEHLMFEGSPNIKRGEYFKYIQNAGGDNNAGTSFDYTTYYEVLPSNQLELGLWLESERMLHLKIDSAGLETQRKVVKEERKSRFENQPYGSFEEQIFSNAFHVSPYRWIPIGSVQYIDQAKINEFMDFYKKYYVPENAVLAIAGDMNKKTAKELAEKYFDEIPKGKEEIIRPKIFEPAQKEEIRKTVYDNIQLPGVFMAYHMPAQGTDDYYALNMLQNLLSVGQSSMMYKTLVDSLQLAVQTESFPYALEDAGLFIILGIVNMGVKPENLENGIDKLIDQTKTSPITDLVFEKLRNQTETSFVNKNSTFAGISENLANYYTFFGNTNLINTEIEKYMKVTKDDIKRVAQKYLVKSNRVVLYYLPKSQQK